MVQVRILYQVWLFLLLSSHNFKKTGAGWSQVNSVHSLSPVLRFTNGYGISFVQNVDLEQKSKARSKNETYLKGSNANFRATNHDWRKQFWCWWRFEWSRWCLCRFEKNKKNCHTQKNAKLNYQMKVVMMFLVQSRPKGIVLRITSRALAYICIHRIEPDLKNLLRPNSANVFIEK